MTKNQLIEELQKIDGDPEISLWNGFVGDYQPVGEIQVMGLKKERLEHIEDMLRMELCRDKDSFELTDDEESYVKRKAKQIYDDSEYDFPNVYVDEDKLSLWYEDEEKPMVFITAGERGKSTWDRLGTISY